MLQRSRASPTHGSASSRGQQGPPRTPKTEVEGDHDEKVLTGGLCPGTVIRVCVPRHLVCTPKHHEGLDRWGSVCYVLAKSCGCPEDHSVFPAGSPGSATLPSPFPPRGHGHLRAWG